MSKSTIEGWTFPSDRTAAEAKIYRERCSRIDSEIAEAYYQRVRAWLDVQSAEGTLAFYGREVKRSVTGKWGWGREEMTPEEVFDYLDAHADAIQPRDQRKIDQAIDKYSEAWAWSEYCSAEYVEAAKQYEGWTRAYLVPKGHIHSSMHCSSCYPTTEYVWLTDLSGADESEIIEYAKEVACTVCYPDAPIEEYQRQADAAKAATRCSGTGSTDWEPRDGSPRWGTRYAICPGCGTYQSVTSTGKIRAHKPA